jgi:ArsR family transcriptional regulator
MCGELYSVAYLRGAGIFSARPEGKWMHYRIERPDDARALPILEATLMSLKADREMHSDLVRLGKACCAPRRLVTLLGAPLPTAVSRNG